MLLLKLIKLTVMMAVLGDKDPVNHIRNCYFYLDQLKATVTKAFYNILLIKCLYIIEFYYK